ncbi:hydroxymethylglutaryl-CoA lyase [Szabonella alba]|uniref:Hydroxymethylglutaryl-CoA lyase n=1 Tax=Szabonella alba TaxID=2804194 RepID=A0A8K0Y243_9RHOB|nr:hydroxymethylglutaryl-CoA lyase [Szabonella alba]MBL4916849.1 hydroxymethylglutaryl-CoA lyase [Szabonella alba]
MIYQFGQNGAAFPRRVRVVEVGTRDGFQSQAEWIPTEAKLGVLKGLIAAGLREFEATSFVSPRAVPQLRDGAELLAALGHPPGVKLTALVPNAKGAEAAAAAGIGAMVVFVSASESHNLKNLNRTRAASLEGLAQVRDIADAAGIPMQGAIATSFGCPFEGEVPVESVLMVARAYHDLGIRHITLGDTTGVATPPLVAERVRSLRAELPDLEIALHFHNTRGVGLANVMAGLAEGIDIYESSVAGLGGCPFVPRATGNISTEDLVYLLHECGIETGIDLDALCDVARAVEAIIGHELAGQVMKAGPRLQTAAMDEVRTACG